MAYRCAQCQGPVADGERCSCTPNFAAHPETITEIRAHKDQKSGSWTPRDVLIAMLREIDSGKVDPKVLVVAYAMTTLEGGHGAQSAFKMSTPPDQKEFAVYSAVGVLESVRDLILACRD